MMSPIKFLLKRICGLEEVVWKIPRRLFSACQSLVSERNERSIFESIFWSDASNQFSSHEDIWFEGRYCLVFGPPDIWIYGFIYTEPPCWLVSAQENIWFSRRNCLKNSKMDGCFYAWPSLIFKWIDLSNDSVSPFCVSLRSNRHLFLKKRYCLKNWRQLPLWHNTMNRSAVGP